MSNVRDEIRILQQDYLKLKCYHDRLKYYTMVRLDYQYTVMVGYYENRLEVLANKTHLMKMRRFNSEASEIPYPKAERQREKVMRYLSMEWEDADEEILHDLYRRIIEKTDPLLNSEAFEKQQTIRRNTLETYVKRKEGILRSIWEEVSCLKNVDIMSNDSGVLYDKKKELEEAVKNLQVRIMNLKSSQVYRNRNLFLDQEKLKNRQNELKLKIRELKDSYDYYSRKVRENERFNQKQ